MSEVSKSNTKPSNLDPDTGRKMMYAMENWLACPNRFMEMFPRGTDFPMSPINEDLISRDNNCPSVNCIGQSMISNAHHGNNAPVEVYDQPNNSDYEMIS
ncbi:hypothetical protein QR98_0070460 [Sarcoptes scabiei]|uniref:Uncharacterized protein n=1 Tax=Sarcoptes scabiei TaxID=52283 RepID=A0A132AC07_SARSC|nr:hypothetical protein QR98_0070460 [Sarcoptes scabiei]